MNQDQPSTSSSEEPKKEKTGFNSEEEANALKQQMSRYLGLQPKYAMRRLLPADLKHLHSQVPMEEEGLKQFEHHKPLKWLRRELVTATPNGKKGGIRIGNLNFNWYVLNSNNFWMSFIKVNNLLHNSLKVNQTDEMIRASRKAYECTLCETTMHLSVLEWARHQERCAKKTQERAEKEAVANSSSSKSGKDTLNKLYYCRHCDREFAEFTSIDILRHRRQHESSRH